MFMVRLHREGLDRQPRWRGVIELVGTEERRAVAGVLDIADFIERRLGHDRRPDGARAERFGGTG